jgi:hypothetical protein
MNIVYLQLAIIIVLLWLERRAGLRLVFRQRTYPPASGQRLVASR